MAETLVEPKLAHEGPKSRENAVGWEICVSHFPAGTASHFQPGVAEEGFSPALPK
jgi:hypothetical protein